MEVEIPSHFLCPISLQLMNDPVTVSTGITYDRPSIELWLSTKHNKNSGAVAVCPVTKQPLSGSVDLTPNHTLRRLIQSWCTLNGVDRIPTPKPRVDRSAITKLLSTAGSSPTHFADALSRLKSIALTDKSSLRSSGAVPFLASHLMFCRDQNDAVETLSALSEIDASDDELKSVMSSNGEELVARLTRFLSEGDSESRFFSIKLLLSLYSVADPNQLMAVKTEVFTETVKLLRDRHMGTKWALKLLFEVNPWGRNRVKAVNAGATEALIEILLDGPEQKRVCELAMAVLDQLCGCAEGRAGLLGHGAGLAVVSKRILRVSNLVSDRAVRVIGSVSRHSANGAVLAEMLQVGVVAKLCLVVQVECSSKTKGRAKEILSTHSRVWKSSPCVPANLLRSFPS